MGNNQAPEPEDKGWFHLDVHPWVFFTSGGLIFLFVVMTLVFQANVDDFFSTLQSAIGKYTGWFFVWTMNIILVYVISLLLGRFSDIRLGGAEAVPEFTTLGWFSMLFSAGMGIGLLFYGVAEPMFHYVASPLVEPGTAEAARIG